MQLQDLAQVIRSKNAGPRCTTLDIMFASQADYERVCRSQALSAAVIARLYGLPQAQVKVIHHPQSWAIKVALPRRLTAGDPGDRDVYGAQQHARLLDIAV